MYLVLSSTYPVQLTSIAPLYHLASVVTSRIIILSTSVNLINILSFSTSVYVTNFTLSPNLGSVIDSTLISLYHSI